jgi:hypothetical protein
VRREAATLGVTVVFALFLAATSKAGPHSATPLVEAAVAATYPDASGWAPFDDPSVKLAAQTPPDATIDCAKTGVITTCTVERRTMTFSFGGGGRPVSDIAADLRKKPGAKLLYDTPNAVIIHRSDPAIGEWCEYVTGSAAKLMSASVYAEGTDPQMFKAIAPQDQDCFDIVAFAATLVTTP